MSRHNSDDPPFWFRIKFYGLLCVLTAAACALWDYLTVQLVKLFW